MNFLKNLLPIVCLFFFVTTLSAQATKNSSQMHTVDKSIKKLVLNVSSEDIEIQQTKGSRINIETTIELSTGNVNLLNYLEKSGRYDMEMIANHSEGTVELVPNKSKKVIVIKGAKIKESVKYKIFVPENIVYVETLDGNLSESFTLNN